LTQLRTEIDTTVYKGRKCCLRRRAVRGRYSTDSTEGWSWYNTDTSVDRSTHTAADTHTHTLNSTAFQPFTQHKTWTAEITAAVYIDNQL